MFILCFLMSFSYPCTDMSFKSQAKTKWVKISQEYSGKICTSNVHFVRWSVIWSELSALRRTECLISYFWQKDSSSAVNRGMLDIIQKGQNERRKKTVCILIEEYCFFSGVVELVPACCFMFCFNQTACLKWLTDWLLPHTSVHKQAGNWQGLHVVAAWVWSV